MLRNLVKSLYLRAWVLPRIHRFYGTLSVADTFQHIYRTRAWGGNGEIFSSGLGSRGSIADLYCAFVIKFIRDHQIRSVVDLGCGDFAVGRRIVEATGISYTGLDVVHDLIEHHKHTFPRVSFSCVDITQGPLPSAELCLIRQVLQHLSNGEIAKVLGNLGGFSRILISEDVPVDPKSFTRDKVHGPDVRAYYGSGVYVDRPPFSMQIAESWSLPFSDTSHSILRTVLLDQVQCE
jgi:hypothetical protein